MCPLGVGIANPTPRSAVGSGVARLDLRGPTGSWGDRESPRRSGRREIARSRPPRQCPLTGKFHGDIDRPELADKQMSPTTATDPDEPFDLTCTP